jgi:2,3-bisphosphoglycerate-independent phosphoglycerate mutase
VDELMATCPFVKGNASGLAVGLPEGQMGNSEVGHLNIGAGRIIYQVLTHISKEIKEGGFFQNPELLAAVNNCKEKGSDLHLYGLVSDGGVHSHNTHIYGLLELAKRNNLDRVFVHCFLDGRDTPPASGKHYVEELEAKMKEIGVGAVATVQGRYYAMDRDNNYDRTKIAYDALTKGIGVEGSSAPAAIQASYDIHETDEFMKPAVIMKDGKPVATIKDGDAIIFYNFRPDRARQITRAFCDDDFSRFERGKRLDVFYVCFADYDHTIQNKEVAFHKITINNTFGQWIAAKGWKQERIAETEKYAHVTFFFNGGVEEPNPGESRTLIPSPKEVATYDLKPEMSAHAVCDRLVEAIKSKEFEVIIINFANPDMVGHTGVEPAAIKAIEVVDECVGRAVAAIREVDGMMFICAAHGNAEQMIDYDTGEPHTAHTTNPVPFILVNFDPAYTLRTGGCLADIVPTMIEMMGETPPAEMTGTSLLEKRP